MNFAKAIALVLFALPFAAAAEPPKPTISEKEIVEKWLKLFDGESTYGWKIEGDSKVNDGVWTLGGEKATTATYLIDLPVKSFLIKSSASGLNGKKIFVAEMFDSAAKDKKSLVSFGPVEFLYAGIPKGDDRGLTRFHIVVPAGSAIHINKFVVDCLGPDPKPLFNGKDLDGWKVFEDPKRKLPSEFTVTKEGELKVSNGPGDLQTKAKYADFLLQFQCKTNGDSLNSGIFFRCIEGQYQNGYECQIHNGMTDKDPAKPKDFGTGAIYRRQAARKIVAKDKEWFSVTLVAHGDRFASWVNGYPVLHWQDDRAADENPRKGLRKEAGHLSIQGHDPTTDILFKDLKIVEFPKK